MIGQTTEYSQNHYWRNRARRKWIKNIDLVSYLVLFRIIFIETKFFIIRNNIKSDTKRIKNIHFVICHPRLKAIIVRMRLFPFFLSYHLFISWTPDQVYKASKSDLHIEVTPTLNEGCLFTGGCYNLSCEIHPAESPPSKNLDRFRSDFFAY